MKIWQSLRDGDCDVVVATKCGALDRAQSVEIRFGWGTAAREQVGKCLIITSAGSRA